MWIRSSLWLPGRQTQGPRSSEVTFLTQNASLEQRSTVKKLRTSPGLSQSCNSQLLVTSHLPSPMQNLKPTICSKIRQCLGWRGCIKTKKPMIYASITLLRTLATGANWERKLLETNSINPISWQRYDRPIICLWVIKIILKLKRNQSNQ